MTRLEIAKLVILLFSSLLCKLVDSSFAGISIKSCSNRYSVNKKYARNVKTLLAELKETSNSSLSFYSTAVGESPDEVYGLYLCRGNDVSGMCGACVNSIFGGSRICEESVVYFDHCMVRYANYSFIGFSDDRLLRVDLSEESVTPQSVYYNRTLMLVLRAVIDDAAYYEVGTMPSYATWLAKPDNKQVRVVYGMAQCTPDISKEDCSDCLKTAHSYLQQKFISYGSVAESGWAMLPSCQLRFSNNTFSSATSFPALSAFPLAACFTIFFIIIDHVIFY